MDMIGLLLFAIYLVAVSIVLVNILIAMMSHSFEAIQVVYYIEISLSLFPERICCSIVSHEPINGGPTVSTSFLVLIEILKSRS